MIRYLVFFCLLISSTCYAEPRIRPDAWGTPVIGTNLQNLYLVDKGVYRSEQPKRGDIDDLRSLGIREILNLRELHSDEDDLTGTNFVLHSVKMHTGAITVEQIVEALRIIKNRKGPVLIHCWHGSDRTGVTIAAYRIIFNNWSKAEALDEMINGGYGYHAKIYPQLITLVENLDVEKMKQVLHAGQ